MSKLFEQLLKTRHLTSDFLQPQYESLTDPFVLPDMDRAVARIKKAVAGGEKVLIYGDYDVDGVTASTLMFDTLRLAGLPADQIEIMLPDRFVDGYGMSSRLVERAKSQGATLVITVDCGSRSHDIIRELSRLHIDTIVTDHHECDDHLPEAIAVINPKRPDFCPKSTAKSPKSVSNSSKIVDASTILHDLAGVGVAFKLAAALVQQNLIKNGQEKWLLDLVLLGTICDSMPLTGENRTLCYYGLKVLAKTRRPGLKALISSAKIRAFTSDNIGFRLGPRLNAAGRLETAEIALNLLRTTSRTEAAALAAELENLNNERRKQQSIALNDIKARGIGDDPVIVQTGAWHEGIIGIVAGRLVEQHHRPAFVLAELEGGLYKGSARSFGDFNLAEALAAVKDTIIGGGGHAGAAGLTLDSQNLAAFRTNINAYYRSLHLTDQERFLVPQADLAVTNLADFTLDFLDELDLLEPFGTGNPSPIFRLHDIRIANATRLGADRNHLRLDIRDQKGHELKLIAFFAPETWLNLTPADQISPLIQLCRNEFNGVTSVEGRILSVDLAEN